MKEATDPKRDGFMRLEEVIEHMANGWRLSFDDGEYCLTKTAGKVLTATIQRLMDEGWIASRNTCCVLTDEGHRAYMRSTDELGDGKLIPPDKASEGQA